MKRSISDVLLHGAIGGVVAGGVVAGWFFVLDLVAGRPFWTPELLAEVLFSRPEGAAGLRLVVAYTVLHFGMFALLGVGAALALRATNLAPALLLGVPFGLGVLDAVHYSALLLTGSRVLTVLPSFHVLGANLAAGFALMAYLHRVTREQRPLGPAVFKLYPVVARGLVTGLWGGAALALWLFLVDIVSGAPFGTPAALGSFILLGAQSPTQVQTTAGIVAAYTVVHFVAFSAVGIAFVAIADQLRRAIGLWLLAAMGFIVLEAAAIPTLSLATEWVLGSRAWWAVGVGNLVGIGAMGAWLWYTDPALRREFASKPAALT